MNQLKAIQSSVDTQRKRNSSFKQEKSYYEQAKRRKSVYMDQMEDYSQNYILKNYKSFLPQIKRDHLNSDGQDIVHEQIEQFIFNLILKLKLN